MTTDYQLLVEEMFQVWQGGGKLMIPLAVLAFAIYFYALDLFGYFRKASSYQRIKETVLNEWIRKPSSSQGPVGEMLHYSQDGACSVKDIKNRFAEIVAAHLPRLNRRILFLGILVTMAPLMGLLGTVMGMLTTFKGISGIANVREVVASGISEALITTQTGLIIAIPGYMMVYSLQRKLQELAAFLARLESRVTQHLSRKLS